MAAILTEDPLHIPKGKILSRQKRMAIDCTTQGPCTSGQGDCDADSECLGDLECSPPLNSGMDICYCPTTSCNIGMTYLKYYRVVHNLWCSLFINKRFELNEIFQRIASKFAIFYV